LAVSVLDAESLMKDGRGEAFDSVAWELNRRRLL